MKRVMSIRDEIV